MPTRRIHSISLAMPSSVMLPFIQCHQTRGRALCGGSRNSDISGSPPAWPNAGTGPVTARASASAIVPDFNSVLLIMPSSLPSARYPPAFEATIKDSN